MEYRRILFFIVFGSQDGIQKNTYFIVVGSQDGIQKNTYFIVDGSQDGIQKNTLLYSIWESGYNTEEYLTLE